MQLCTTCTIIVKPIKIYIPWFKVLYSELKDIDIIKVQQYQEGTNHLKSETESH